MPSKGTKKTSRMKEKQETRPKRPLYPKPYSFSVRLEGERFYFPCTAFCLSEEQAKVILNERFDGKIAEWHRLRLADTQDSDFNTGLDNDRLISKLSELLNGVCNALKGSCPPGILWSWHDLPEIAQDQHKALQNIMQILGPEPGGCTEGCATEISLALAELKKVGIEYQRKRTRP